MKTQSPPDAPPSRALTRRLPPGSDVSERATATGEPVLGRYRLERRLGAGGYGVVWLAADETLERSVAVKVIDVAEEGVDRERAVREARAAARLNHPGIVALYELGSDAESVYLVSELVRGSSLARLMHAGELSDRRIARIGTVLCDALDHAHAQGVIHRDIKPQNVIVPSEPASGAGVAKLTDFGVAHLVDDDPLTRTGDVVGTLAYMAPEQARGRAAGEAADVYSLALTLYEGFAGDNPVRAGGPAATARRVGRPLPRLGARRRDLPSQLCRAIDSCLDPRPARRPALADLREALVASAARLSDEDGLVGPPRLERVRRHPRAHPRRVAVLRDGEHADELPGAPRLGDLSAARRPLALPKRLGAGVAAGALALGALVWLGHAAAVAAPAAAVVLALVLALPRLGWLAALAAGLGWTALGPSEAGGSALVAASALAPTAVLLPAAGALWSLAALAPLLGAVGLAPAFPALAGLVHGALRRAGLGAAGFLWLAGAELLSGRTLLGAGAGAGAGAGWQGSPARAASEALWPALTSGRLGPALGWALFAALLPLVVRGRSLVLDLAGAAAWALLLALAQAWLADPPASRIGLEALETGLPGAALGALLVVLVRRAARGRRPGRALALP